MSDITDAMVELTDVYQEITGSAPTMTLGAETVAIIPNAIGNDPSFVPGGIAESETIEVMTAIDAWDTIPDDGDVVALAGHPVAPDADYQVLTRSFREGHIAFTLGNEDSQ